MYTETICNVLIKVFFLFGDFDNEMPAVNFREEKIRHQIWSKDQIRLKLEKMKQKKKKKKHIRVLRWQMFQLYHGVFHCCTSHLVLGGQIGLRCCINLPKLLRKPWRWKNKKNPNAKRLRQNRFGTFHSWDGILSITSRMGIKWQC